MGKIIAVANQKGGVGKTTSAVNISAGLGMKGKKTLLIDMDPQGNSSSGVGINRRKLNNTIYNVMIGQTDVKNIMIQTEFENLSLLPSSLDLAGAEIEIIDREHRESILKSQLLTVKNDFDYLIIDCPPSLGLITTNALNSADTLLIPIQCEYYALEGLSQLMNSVRRVKRYYNENLDIEGVLLTMYDGRLNLTQQVVEQVKHFFPQKVFSVPIPRTVRLSEAPGFGKPIEYYDANSKGSVAYKQLCEEIINNNETQEVK